MTVPTGVLSSSTPPSAASLASRTSSTRWPLRQILADLGMGPIVVAAGLLHDTVEDTDYTLDECRAEFGDTVAGLVDGVTKLSQLEVGDSAQAETIRKLVVAMSRDVAYLGGQARRPRTQRSHLALCEDHVRAQKKARETLDVYAPLANRLGMNAIKTELEELSFKVLYPKIYNEIVVLVARRAGQRDVYLKQILGGDQRGSRRAEHQGIRHRTPEGLLLHLPEDDRARP